MQSLFTTPILFLIFNRPDTTKRVFSIIQQVKPKQLFIAADGPRIHIPEEKEKCYSTRNIIKQIDWHCDVKTLFRDSNLGCREAVKSAITWFFDTVEYGIILEDDCLPNLSFFPFCEQLLEYYQNDEKIGAISGNNFWANSKNEKDSYFFSKHLHIWGWATWRRCWQKTATIYQRASEKDYSLRKIIANASLRKKSRDAFWQLAKGVLDGLDTWDYQLCLTMYANNYLIAHPNVNLVENIGFGKDATHTTNTILDKHTFVDDMVFPLKHPLKIFQNETIDRIIEKDWQISRRNVFKKAFYQIRDFLDSIASK